MLVAPSGNRGVKCRENRIHRQRRFVGSAPLSLSFFERMFVIELKPLALSPAERDRWLTLAIAAMQDDLRDSVAFIAEAIRLYI